MGISESTVNAQIAVGMLRCRQHFQKCGGLAPSAHAAEAPQS
jgi:hypothetical protein